MTLNELLRHNGLKKNMNLDNILIIYKTKIMTFYSSLPLIRNLLTQKIASVIDNPQVIDTFRSNIKEMKTMENHAKGISELYKELIGTT